MSALGFQAVEGTLSVTRVCGCDVVLQSGSPTQFQPVLVNISAAAKLVSVASIVSVFTLARRAAGAAATQNNRHDNRVPEYRSALPGRVIKSKTALFVPNVCHLYVRGTFSNTYCILRCFKAPCIFTFLQYSFLLFMDFFSG